MKLSDVHPDLRTVFKNKFFPPIHWPVVLWLGKKLYKVPPQEMVDGVKLIERTVNGNPVRIYMPEGELSGAAVVIFHGGGLIGGDPAFNDWGGSWYAKELGAVVLSPGYRRAPEHPAPAALNDCWAFWRWLLKEAQRLQIDTHKIALAGVSAGGGLAACLSQRLLDEGASQPVAQILTYPMLDDRTAADKKLDPIKHIMWNNQANRVGWSAYLGAEKVGAKSLPAYVSASRREDLRGLPPAWIGVGDIDLFYEESKEYARRLRDAQVDCVLEVTTGAPHGFDYFGMDEEIVKRHYRSSLNFLKRHLFPAEI
ncbi:MAG: alpha/beta hydrolase [Pseudomonadota bacterium]